MEKEKSYQEIRAELIKKYKNEIFPKISQYEKIREDKQTSFKKLTPKTLGIMLGLIAMGWISLGVLIFILLFIIGSFVPPEEQQNYMNNVFAPVFISFWVIGFVAMVLFQIFFFVDLLRNMPYIKKKKDYKKYSEFFQKNIKNIIMPLVCSCFPYLKWVPDRIHQTEIYENLKLLPKQYPSAIPNYGNYIKYDDCFEGKYKDIEFVIEEVEAGVYNKGVPYADFDGIIIQFKINKKFKGHTVIVPDKAYLGNNKLHHTKLEDIVFEKNYDVYTNDDVEARYLITPSFMNQINDIREKFDANEICAVFYCGVFFLALNIGKDLFNYGSIINSLEDMRPYIKMSEELISILKLIEYFKLDQNIGM